MKRTLAVLTLVLLAGIMFFGCSKNSPVAPTGTAEDISQYLRPEFIDNRPAEVIAQYTLIDCEPVALDKNTPKGAKYALVIGISAYPYPNTLKYCDDDARDWAQRLQQEGYTVTSVIDNQATKNNIESAVNTLASRAIAGNEIAFCYSGHGYKGQMISVDMYYLSDTWLKSKLGNAASTKMAFAFDACQIGSMKSALNGTGRVIAVASSSSSLSYDGDASMSNGVFTYYQMKAFDQLGYIYYEPDCQYACDNFIAWAKAKRLKVSPSYSDTYTGQMDL